MIQNTRITINLSALAHNYHALKNMTPHKNIACVVKADAYGCGALLIVTRLYTEGCRMFFVATYSESQILREKFPDIIIYIFEGVTPETLPLFQKYDLRPVINDLEGLKALQGTDLKPALHFDTGMNRLGLSESETEYVLTHPEVVHNANVSLIMSHLACSDIPNDAFTHRQIERFLKIASHFPHIPKSLAASYGTLYYPKSHCDMVRVGIGLYGGIDHPAFRPVVTFEGRVLQIRTVPKGQSIGYGASYICQRDSILITVSGGYADGLHRSLSHSGYKIYIKGFFAPLVGRMSMDAGIYDITDIPQGIVQKGDYAEFFGTHHSVENCANYAKTISYEILTGLSRRTERVYKV